MSATADTSSKSTREEVMSMRKQAAQSNHSSSSMTSTQSADDATANSLQQSIENALADDRVRIPVGGERIRFRTFNGVCEGHPQEGGEISDRVALNDERLSRMDAADFETQYRDEVDWMCMTLAWSSEPEFMTAEWWESRFSMIRRKEYLNFIQIEREFSERQVKKLRNRGRL